MLDPRPEPQELLRLNAAHFSAPPAGLSRISRYPRLRRLWHSFSGEYLARFLSESGGRVLDVGCGFGSLMEEMRATGCVPSGLDPSPEACGHCRSRGFEVICAPLENTGIAAASYDGAVMWHSIEHLPDPRAALAEIVRVLKPGGTLTVYCPNAGSYAAAFFGACWQGWDPPFHLWHFTPVALKRLVEESGFETIDINTATPEFFSLQSLARVRTLTPGSLLGRLPAGFMRSLPVRMALMAFMRVLDAAMPLRGECIRARFIIRGSRT
jgi:SAM-dependent methyltransferase